MTASKHTRHYGLSQYEEADRPTYAGDYDGDMSKVDAAIYAASLSGGAAVTTNATDLTATQLDAPISDDYNNVRVDMPARSIESEEPHHE